MHTLPQTSLDTQPYWEGLLASELRYQSCGACNSAVFHPRALCPYCLTDALCWRVSGGNGTIYSCSIQHFHNVEANEEPGPKAMGIIALDEGFHMFAEILVPDLLAPDFDSLRIGLEVAVMFDRVAADLVLPKFRPGRRA